MTPTPTLPRLEATGEAAVPADIKQVATVIADRYLGFNLSCQSLYADVAHALLAERQKHDRPASPDLQAEAERVFADVQRAVLVDDAKAEIAKVLQARDERAAQICEQQAREFLSPQYASNQPLGSFCERFACDECAKAIRET